MSSESANDNSLRETIRSNLLQQLSELEILQSMYSRDEISLNKPKAIEEINYFLEGHSDFSPNHLDLTIKLQINDMKLEICVDLPTFYPETEMPDVYIRCNQLNRNQETLLNNNVIKFIEEIHQGDVCIYTILTWLQENIDISSEGTNNETKETAIVSNVSEDKFARYWIHSHHIYNQRKRDEIQSRARDLKLTGFCLPGKPGIVCIEGAETLCKEWWKDIKHMNWKKIVIRKIESFPECEEAIEKKFQSFNEVQFPSKQGKHGDMKKLFKYLEEHGLSQVFNDFFGLNNSNDY